MEPTLHMICGLPGSGKSTYAKKMIEQNPDLLYLSSDDLRVELFGDVNHQEDNHQLFQELHRRARQALESEQSVIIDATNTVKKRRVQEIKSIYALYRKEIHYCGAHISWIKRANRARKKQVPQLVISSMYRSLDIPFYDEGWDEIHLIFPYERAFPDVNESIGRVMDAKDFDSFNHHLIKILRDYQPAIQLSHDRPDQPYTVGEHTYRVFDYIRQNYEGEEKETLLWTAIFHDLGKVHTKRFITKKGKPSEIAYFYGHEYISSQLACNYLYHYGYPKEMILEVCYLVKHHMKLANLSEKLTPKKVQLFGEEMYQKLKLFNEANQAVR